MFNFFCYSPWWLYSTNQLLSNKSLNCWMVLLSYKCRKPGPGTSGSLISLVFVWYQQDLWIITPYLTLGITADVVPSRYGFSIVLVRFYIGIYIWCMIKMAVWGYILMGYLIIPCICTITRACTHMHTEE